MTPILKPATANDIDLLIAMMREYYALDKLDFDPNVARGALETLLNDATLGLAVLIVLPDETVTVGYTFLTFGFSLEFAGRFALVDEIYVVEEYRARGIGTDVLRQLEEQCMTLGFAALRLEVEYDNVAAQRLYRRLGFTAHERNLMTKWTIRHASKETTDR
jgi:ribosomal protein S18 acetylase RimI-like enzyme